MSVQIEYFAIKKSHGSTFGTDLPEPTVLLDMFEGINKLEIPLLEVLLGVAQILYILFVLTLALVFKSQILLRVDSAITFQLAILTQFAIELSLQLFFLDEEVGDTWEELILQKFVVAAPG